MAKVLCDQCVALCCRYIALPIENPENARDYDHIRWYLMHENVVVFIEDKQWYIGFFGKCKHLQPDNRCGVYLTRPRICRQYDTHNCEYHAMDYGYDELFTSAEQLREYADKKLGRSMILKVKPKKPRVVSRKGKKRVKLPVV